MAYLESLYSTQVSAMASDIVAPGQVQNLAFTVEQGKVNLSWDAVTKNSDGSDLVDLAGYRVFRKKTAGDTFVEIGTTANDVVVFEDSSVKDGASYLYAVAAYDDEPTPQEGIKSNELVVKTITSVPQGVASSASDSMIILDWTSVKDELDLELNQNLAGYNIYRSETDGSGYVNIGNVTADVETFEDTDVVNGTTYFYVVTSFDNSL
jgi:uncharacterized protein